MSLVGERNLCTRCLKPRLTCFCEQIRPFRVGLQIVILQHPRERRRTVGTARIAHLCIENSKLIYGRSFDQNKEVDEIISHPDNHCVILYPGKKSLNISELGPNEIKAAFSVDKNLVIFVIDGTWGTAASMVRTSPNLQKLSQICFRLDKKSEYRFRKQPMEHCLSTVEAIHRLVEILDPKVNPDNLLEIFRAMVEYQIGRLPRTHVTF
jgi:DTW domain-containing protein